ncbi:DUF6400 family protein [Streptomyces sp. FXJ1.172]|uniref:DUF6400 family protein n=1 Tax=Streptomyces sp. FXJ1.172 TaxID=710705 RepID=UPI0007CFFC8C|nr:DUF6400 family protein [Streptomyces sp. FXJ1.172]WEO93318.1 DUF6400 family protein [Streptomyces sp. FXJ1.172]
MTPHDPTPETPHRNEPARTPDATEPPSLACFDLDFTAHEIERRAQVLAALGPDWDPVEALRGEEQAYDLLYAGLNAEQQRLYDDLVTAGVLPRRAGSDGRGGSDGDDRAAA